MADKTGLGKVVDADRLNVELPEDPKQLGLLGDDQPEPAAGEVVRTGQPGRPAGSKNRSTAEMVRYLNSFGQGPVVGMARIVNMIDPETGIPDFARVAGHIFGKDPAAKGEDGLKPGEIAAGADFWLKAAKELAPYQHQKLPMAIDIKPGADAQIIVINAGKTVLDAATSENELLNGVFDEIEEAQIIEDENQ